MDSASRRSENPFDAVSGGKGREGGGGKTLGKANNPLMGIFMNAG